MILNKIFTDINYILKGMDNHFFKKKSEIVPFYYKVDKICQFSIYVHPLKKSFKV